MTSLFEITVLKLCEDFARSISKIKSNKINRQALNTSNPEHITIIDNTSKRFLFCFLVALFIEENGLSLVPQNHDNFGIYLMRKKFLSKFKKNFKGTKYSILDSLLFSITNIFSGSEIFTPFKPRLFDPTNIHNRFVFNWKFFDSDLTNSIEELFKLWPDPDSGLIPIVTPDIRKIADLYTFLLDFELALANEHIFINKFGEKEASAIHANINEIKRGRLIKKGELYYRYSRNKSRANGIVYTPDEIVQKIVTRTLKPLLDKKNDNIPLRILDPACGTGRFLLGAMDFLASSTCQNAENIIRNSLFGVDTDPLAIELAEIQLMLRMLPTNHPVDSLKNNLIVANTLTGIDSRFIEAFLRAEKTIECQDQEIIQEIDWKTIWQKINGTENSNILETEKQKLVEIFDSVVEYFRIGTKNNFKEKLKFKLQNLYNLKPTSPDLYINRIPNFHPEIFFTCLYYNPNGESIPLAGFDAIIGNPPYGDILGSADKKLLTTLGYLAGGSGNNDIFRFFVERSLKLLKPSGILGFILPNTFLTGKKYLNFRRRTLELACILEIVDFGRNKRFNQDVFTLLIFLRKKPCEKTEPVFITSLDGSFENIKIDKLKPEILENEPWIPSGELITKIISDKKFVPLDPFIADCGDVGINYQRRGVGWQSRSPSRIAAEIFYEGEKQHPNDFPYLKGEDIERFIIKPKAQRWLRHDWKERICEGEIVNVNLEWAKVPVKILTRQTSDSIIAAIDKSGYLTGRSIHTTIIKDTRYSPYYILAVLNSEVINRIYQELTRERGRAQAQVKLSSLRKLPIRTISFEHEENAKIHAFHIEKILEGTDFLKEIIKDLIITNNEFEIHQLIAYLTMHIENFLFTNDINKANNLTLKLNEIINLLYMCVGNQP